MPVSAEFQVHLDKKATTLCRAWQVRRRDGVTFGFTDHDRDISFDGVTHKAESGLTAQALQQTTGLSVDNSEAVGALSAAAITEADLAAGRYDGARIDIYLVNWQSPEMRHHVFRGTLGEVETGGGGFRAEIRGLADRLNRPQGRVYQRLCGATLGDGACGVNLNDPRYRIDVAVAAVNSARELRLPRLPMYASEWFTRGRFEVLSGSAAGLSGFIKADLAEGAARTVSLWQDLRAPISAGDRVRLRAGCDKRPVTCREKFNNFLNFRGFPHIPGEDWLTAYPRRGDGNDGGSRGA